MGEAEEAARGLHWELGGECILEGFMLGQAIDLYQQGKCKLMRFSIVQHKNKFSGITASRSVPMNFNLRHRSPRCFSCLDQAVLAPPTNCTTTARRCSV